jgi:deferrochelatase/peroxidase EfeB
LTTSEEEPLDPLTPKQERLRKKYEGMYTAVGAATFGFRPYAGMVLMRYAKDRSEELIRMARHYPFLYKWLEYFADSSDSFTFVIGHGIMLWAIMSEMGRLRGNPAVFGMMGLNPEQIMQPLPGMPTQEELDAFIANQQNGHRGN